MAERFLRESTDFFLKNTDGGLSVGELSRYQVAMKAVALGHRCVNLSLWRKNWAQNVGRVSFRGWSLRAALRMPWV